MRVELRDGQWAELRERITHAEDKELKRLKMRGAGDKSVFVDWQTELVRTFTKSWHVLDLEGQAIPLGDADAIERSPSDIAEVLADAAAEIYIGATVPNAPTPPSSDGSSSPTAKSPGRR